MDCKLGRPPQIYPDMCGSTQSQFGVQVPFSSHNQSLALSSLPVPCCGITRWQVGLHGLLPCVWGELWWNGCHQRPRLFLMWCFCKHQPWPLLPHPGSTLGQGHLCVPQLSLFPSCVSVVPQPDKRVCLPCTEPQDWVPYLWLVLLAPQGRCPSMLTSVSSESPPRDMGPNVITFIPFIPIDICILLRALVV